MRLLESLAVALSTYSAIPMPQFEWNRDNMKYAICFLPAVGVICGGALAGWYWVCNASGVDGVVFAALAVCLPLLITGGIHMDGFMDTMDALSSHLSRERKLEILKDPHCGAFAVIYCGMYLLCQFGLFYGIYRQGLVYAFCPVFILSRSLSALCAVTMPNARKTGMLCAFTQDTEKNKAVSAALLVFLAGTAAAVVISPLPGNLGMAAAVFAMLLYRKMALKEFGGATGDTAGFLLQVCELAALGGIWTGGMFL